MKSRRPDCLHHRKPPPHGPLLPRCFGRAAVRPIASVIGMMALTVNAQDAATRPTLQLIPEFGIRETLTDNVHLTSAARQSDLITELTPQLRLSSNGGRIRGFLDYSLQGVVYARESSSNTVLQSLSAAGTAEAIDNWAFIDGTASISQQNISALGTRSPDPSLLNDNRTEVSSVSLSPYVRGHLGSAADYEARLSVAATNSAKSSADSTTTAAQLRVASGKTQALLGWSADLSHQVIDFRETGSHEDDRLTGVLNVAATPELVLSARAGREINDFVTLEKKAYGTHGWGVTWTPSERTRLDVVREQRFFGSSHSVRFEHRMPRSVWTFTDTRDISTDANGNATKPGTVFDLLFDQFASLVPDPIQRAAVVDAFLQSNGLTRLTLANGGFLTSAASVQRRQEASFAILRPRTTIIASIFRNDARRLDSAAIVTDDLSNGNLLRERGLSLNVSHRLTPLSSLSVAVLQNRTHASLGDQSTTLRSVTTTWSSRLRESVDVSLAARRALYDSATVPYSENALIANLRVRF